MGCSENAIFAHKNERAQVTSDFWSQVHNKPNYSTCSTSCLTYSAHTYDIPICTKQSVRIPQIDSFRRYFEKLKLLFNWDCNYIYMNYEAFTKQRAKSFQHFGRKFVMNLLVWNWMIAIQLEMACGLGFHCTFISTSAMRNSCPIFVSPITIHNLLHSGK